MGPDATHAEKLAHHIYNRRWWILAVVALAQLMVVLDSTVVNIALPSAQKALAFSTADRQWIVTGYALSFGSLLLLGGRVADFFGRKRVFLVGLIGFSVASAIGGAATGFPMLVSARVVQGAFGALLAPTALSLLTTTFSDPKERGKAFGVFGAIAGGGAAIGLLLGGFLTQYLSWRWSLYVNLVFAIAATFGAVIFLRHDEKLEKKKLDLPGVLSASISMFSLVYGFSHAETAGWSNGITLAFLAIGVVLLVAFVLIEKRVEHPLLPMRVVLDRTRGGSYIAVFLAAVGMFGVFLFLTYYLQSTLGYSPVKTGVAFLPMVAVLVVVAAVGTAVLLPRVGPKPMVVGGMLIAALGLMLLTRISLHSGYVSVILPALLVLGAGMGFIFAPSMNAATAGIDPEDAGVASATVNTSQQIGGSIGTALLNTLAATTATAYLAHKVPNQLLLAQAGIHSYVTAFRWSAVIFVAGAVVSLIVLQWGKQELSEGEFVHAGI
ncbi:DHA2 family efflux MFS transporter permease subunit [Acidithrix sp. C25]|uniref:MFS transporter n=1 Tax=Acidithrix sp. C25 TaxID=1671482 RepID=UPI0006981637